MRANSTRVRATGVGCTTISLTEGTRESGLTGSMMGLELRAGPGGAGTGASTGLDFGMATGSTVSTRGIHTRESGGMVRAMGSVFRRVGTAAATSGSSSAGSSMDSVVTISGDERYQSSRF